MEARRSWIYTLKPYLEGVDEIRICPEDPKGDRRLRDDSTSYVLNDYIAAPRTFWRSQLQQT